LLPIIKQKRYRLQSFDIRLACYSIAMRKLVVIAHNLRSTHNVGSLLRTAEGLGIEKVILSGYTPYPIAPKDERLPHLAKKIDKDIRKTALGAEALISWEHQTDIQETIQELRKNGYMIVALEQAKDSISLPEFCKNTPPEQPIALILGREVEGVESEVLKLCDKIVEIPMRGKKESFNVIQAAAIAMYILQF